MIFKANGCYKYGCGLLETLIQTQVLPEELSFRLIWNRAYNSYNIQNTNIPLDLQVPLPSDLFYINQIHGCRYIDFTHSTLQL